jgi:hypothetical protein
VAFYPSYPNDALFTVSRDGDIQKVIHLVGVEFRFAVAGGEEGLARTAALVSHARFAGREVAKRAKLMGELANLSKLEK